MKISNPTAKLGEDLACEYLKKKGYKIIERNYRIKYTEVDIICVKKNVLVFAEVKTRTTDKFGSPLEQISSKKIKNLVRTAEFYSKSNPNLPKSLRIDAISVKLEKSGESYKIEHIKNISY